MIYILGDSFTKWFWPSWADWLSKYTDEQIVNMGRPGHANEVYYWELMNRRTEIKEDDTVYIMLGGSNRVCTWYDDEWIKKNDCRGFFPRQDGKLEFSEEPWRGFYRLHLDNDCSYTNMAISYFNIVYQIQSLLDTIGCKYKLMFWQNPWLDVRPIMDPKWTATWTNREYITQEEINVAKDIMKIKPVKSLLELIDWSKFVTAPTIDDPTTFVGLWEYRLDRTKRDPSLLQYIHTDEHPDSVSQHDYLIEMIKPELVEKYADLSKEIALHSLQYEVEHLERSKLIPEIFDEDFPFFDGIDELFK